jgi:hypothetical protein
VSGSSRCDYHSAEEKTLFLINSVITTSEYDHYDWLAFVDDDAVLNTKKFEYIMPHLNKDYIYGLRMHGYGGAPELLFPSGGSGYFISPQLIKKQKLMIDNKWGVEDVAIGMWLKQNNIHFEDHFTIGDQRYFLKLNGWFPFHEEQNMGQGGNPDEFIIEKVKENKEKVAYLKSSMTHHYIKSDLLMNYINDIFEEWEPEDMKPNKRN